MTTHTTKTKAHRLPPPPVPIKPEIQPKKEGGGEEPFPEKKEAGESLEIGNPAENPQSDASIEKKKGAVKPIGLLPWTEPVRVFSMTIKRIGGNVRMLEAIFNDGLAVPVTVWCKDSSKLKHRIGRKITAFKNESGELVLIDEKGLQRRAR